MTIAIVGHGYVGLVTACIFADFGNTVYVIGHTKEKIERLASGDPIIYEPGLKELLQKNLKKERLIFTLDMHDGISRADIVFITVGTPPRPDGQADVSTVYAVAKSIAASLKQGFTVVSCKSTVPVGTNSTVQEILQKEKPAGAECAVASCPEFLREGTGIQDTLMADRVVIGSNSQKAIDLLLELHRPIAGKRIITDIASAELIKYASNAMLATKISFANLISFFCEKTGANADVVLSAVGMDKRIGSYFLSPGVGYGGSCLPKDVKALLNVGKQLGVDTSYLEAVEKVNIMARTNLVEKIVAHIPKGKIAVWGLSFKSDTDDVRETSAIPVISALLKKGYTVSAYDPAAQDTGRKVIGDTITYASSAYDAAEHAQGICILTDWNEFKQIDLIKVKQLLTHPIIIDGRNLYEPADMRQLGYTYVSTGRPSVLL